jgi:hypothetical protein
MPALQHARHRDGELPPVGSPGLERTPSGVGELVASALSARYYRPATADQPSSLKPVQGRVDSPGRQIELAAAV